MQKNRVKMVPKQVFTRAGIKSPPPYSMSIPEAPSCRVNTSYSPQWMDNIRPIPYPDFRVPYPYFRVWFEGTILSKIFKNTVSFPKIIRNLFENYFWADNQTRDRRTVIIVSWNLEMDNFDIYLKILKSAILSFGQIIKSH